MTSINDRLRADHKGGTPVTNGELMEMLAQHPRSAVAKISRQMLQLHYNGLVHTLESPDAETVEDMCQEAYWTLVSAALLSDGHWAPTVDGAVQRFRQHCVDTESLGGVYHNEPEQTAVAVYRCHIFWDLVQLLIVRATGLDVVRVEALLQRYRDGLTADINRGAPSDVDEIFDGDDTVEPEVAAELIMRKMHITKLSDLRID